MDTVSVVYIQFEPVAVQLHADNHRDTSGFLQL